MEKEFRKITLTFGIIMAVPGRSGDLARGDEDDPRHRLGPWRTVHPGRLVLLPGGVALVVPPLRPGGRKRTRRSGKSVMKQVTIYTDGACSGNPAQGLGAVLLYMGAIEREISGGGGLHHQQPHGAHGGDRRLVPAEGALRRGPLF